MQTIPGPLVYDERSSAGSRAPFALLPPSIVDQLNYCVIFDDFIEVVNDQTNKWTTIIDTGCTAVVEADSEFGALHFTCDSGDNEGASIQKNETVKFNSGKRLIFEARVLMTDADDGDMAIGLAENHATNPEAMILGAGVWFQINEGSAVLIAKAGTAGATSESTGKSLVDSVYKRVGFVYDGADTCTFYVDRVAVASCNFASLPTALITPSMYYINGTTDTDSAKLDYIFVAAER